MLICLMLARYAGYTSALGLLSFIITTLMMSALTSVNILKYTLDIFQSDKVMFDFWMWDDLLVIFLMLFEKRDRVETSILFLLKLFNEFI